MSFFFNSSFQQLHQRYQGSVLGFLWTLINPALIFVSLSIVFSYLNNWDLKDFGLYFFSGFIFWNFFSNTCLAAADSIVGNTLYVTRVYVPRILLPLASMAVNLVDLLAGFVVLFILMLLIGAPFSQAMLFLPLSLLLAIAIAAGASLLCAVANVFFRDFRHLLQSVLFLWFFLSPILWRPDMFSPRMQAVLVVNPVIPFLSVFQIPIWRGELPSLTVILLGAAFSVMAIALGATTFLMTEKRFYYYL